MRFLRLKWARLLVISGFCLAGSVLRAAENSTQQPLVDKEEFDLAKVQAGGKVAFVSSGERPAVFRAIDNDRRTVFEFSSSDPRPTLIVKVTETKPIHRVSVVIGSQREQVDVYLLNEIPRDLSELDKLDPVASIVDLSVGREAVADFAPQQAHYVALRWAFSKNHSRPLAVAEVGVFTNSSSDPSLALIVAADPPPADPPPGPPIIAAVSP